MRLPHVGRVGQDGRVHGGEHWDAADRNLTEWIEGHRRRALDSYRANPLLVGEHAGQEDSFRTGGYAGRQVLELVQNAADALARSGKRGRVELRLVDGVVYCAERALPRVVDTRFVVMRPPVG